jgi:hypothetical protein
MLCGSLLASVGDWNYIISLYTYSPLTLQGKIEGETEHTI